MDLCKYCLVRGDVEKCLETECNIKESWIYQEATKNTQDDEIEKVCPEQSIPNQFFNWEGYDELDVGVLIFYNVHLNRDIGKFKKGDFFDHAVIDTKRSIMELVETSDSGDEDDESQTRFHLKVSAVRCYAFSTSKAHY